MTSISRRNSLIVTAFGLGSMLLAGGCSKKEEQPKAEGASSAAAAPAAEKKNEPLTLQGAGASFPAPVYSRWFREFSDKNPDVRVNYQSTGSGAGVKSFLENQVDFGASDAAMTDDEIKQANGNVVMIPVTGGQIVLTYNLEGVTGLKLSRDAYAGIFLGEIKKWNDPRIAKTNAGVKLPATDVAVVRRSDGSGTTFVFTQHLAAISEKWKKGPGVGKSVEWPVGVGGRKNDGVAALIQQTPGAIGYVEYSFAVSSKQPMAHLENKSGKFIEPTLKASAAALGAVDLPEDLRGWVTDPEGEESYPIVTYTWILAKKKYEDKAKSAALKKLLGWCLSDGQPLAETLNYIALPEKALTKVKAAVETIE
jgi:phosphate transport system substrate-binding protein